MVLMAELYREQSSEVTALKAQLYSVCFESWLLQSDLCLSQYKKVVLVSCLTLLVTDSIRNEQYCAINIKRKNLFHK